MKNNFDNSLASFESYLAKANEELNELLGESAEGGKTVDDLLKQVKSNIEATCKTAEDCDKLLQVIKTEQDKYNASLTTMKQAAIDYKDGKIDKAKFASIIKEASADLKASYNILVHGDTEDKDGTLEDDDIKFVRDFLVGAKSIIADKKASLGEDAGEGCKESDTDDNDDSENSIAGFIKALDDAALPATESNSGVVLAAGIMSYLVALISSAAVASYATRKNDPEAAYLWKKGRGEEVKAAAKAIKDAKIAVRKKDYDKAISLYEEAKKQYKKLHDEIKKVMPNKVTSKGTVKSIDETPMSFTEAKANALNWCTGRIFACNNAIDDIKDKKNKKAAKDAKKAAKASESAVDPRIIAKNAANAAKAANANMTDDEYLAVYTACLESLTTPTPDVKVDPEEAEKDEADRLDKAIANLTDEAEIPFEDEDPALYPEDFGDDEE